MKRKKFPIGKKRKDRRNVNDSLDEKNFGAGTEETAETAGTNTETETETASAATSETAAETPAAEAGENAAGRSESAEGEASPLAASLEAALKKRDEYLEMAQRVQADFDNYRRRNASLRAESYEDGAREAIKLFLPVVDNLERALEAPSEDEKLREGVAMTLRQMMGILEKRGVTVIDRKGEKFDPRLENAVMQADASQGEPGTVAMVLQKGYRMGDTVLRHAMVQVVAE